MAKAGVRKRVERKGCEGIYYEELASGRRRYIGTWRMRVIDPTHPDLIRWKSVEKRAATLDEAKRLRAEGQMAAREPGVEVDSEKRLDAAIAATRGLSMVPAWVADVEANKPNRSPATVKRNASLIRNHISPHWSKVPVASVGKLDVQKWVKTLEVTLSPATVAKVFALFKSAMDEGVENDLIPKNPARNVDLPEVKEPVTGFLEVAEIRAIADAIDPRYRLAVLLGGLCGLRFQEVFGLTTDDLALDEHTPYIYVRHGLKRDGGVLGDTKSKRSARPVTLTPELVAAIRDHLDTYPDRESELCESPRCQATKHDGVLIANTRGRPVSYWNFTKRAFGPAAIEALGQERGGDVHFHMLRVSHLRQLQDAGDLDSWDLADRLGQMQLRTTRGESRRDLSRQARVAERMAEVQSG